MKNPSNNPRSKSLPLKRDFKPAYILTIIVVVGMGALSLAGLITPNRFYPSEEFIQSYLVNDGINLILGIPILLGSMWLTRRGKLVGLLFWPGALLYVLYNYIAYIFGLPFSLITFVYLALVVLCGANIFVLLNFIDRKSVQQLLAGNVPVKFSGWVLVLFGVLFFIRAIGMLIEANTSQTSLAVSEIGVLIADMVLSVLMAGGGVLLLRQMAFGYASALGLLFAASTLFIGLIMVLLLGPVLIETSIVLTDVIVVFIMGLICFIPFGLFVRGVVKA